MTELDERLLEVQKELKEIETEIKYQREDFKESIKGLSDKRDSLRKESHELREQMVTLVEQRELVDGVSVSWRKDFEVDEDLLEDDYWKTVVDVNKIRSELVNSEWTKPIRGVKIITKPSIRVLTK